MESNRQNESENSSSSKTYEHNFKRTFQRHFYELHIRHMNTIFKEHSKNTLMNYTQDIWTKFWMNAPNALLWNAHIIIDSKKTEPRICMSQVYFQIKNK